MLLITGGLELFGFLHEHEADLKQDENMSAKPPVTIRSFIFIRVFKFSKI